MIKKSLEQVLILVLVVLLTITACSSNSAIQISTFTPNPTDTQLIISTSTPTQISTPLEQTKPPATARPTSTVEELYEIPYWYFGGSLIDSHEIVDSNICVKTDFSYIDAFLGNGNDFTHSQVYYRLNEDGTMDVIYWAYIRNYAGPWTWDTSMYYLANNLASGKALRINYLDNGIMKEFPLVENCETYLSLVYK